MGGVEGLVSLVNTWEVIFFYLLLRGLLSSYELMHFFLCHVQVHLGTKTAYKSGTRHTSRWSLAFNLDDEKLYIPTLVTTMMDFS